MIGRREEAEVIIFHNRRAMGSTHEDQYVFSEVFCVFFSHKY